MFFFIWLLLGPFGHPPHGAPEKIGQSLSSLAEIKIKYGLFILNDGWFPTKNDHFGRHFGTQNTTVEPYPTNNKSQPQSTLIK